MNADAAELNLSLTAAGTIAGGAGSGQSQAVAGAVSVLFLSSTTHAFVGGGIVMMVIGSLMLRKIVSFKG